MSEITVRNEYSDIEKILEREKRLLCKYLSEDLQIEFMEKCYIAGGCIYSYANDEIPKDIDFFVEDEDFIKKLKSYFELKQKDDSNIIITNYAITYDYFQIITKFFGSPEDVVSEFDFKHNMFYVDYEGTIKTLSNFRYLHNHYLFINTNRMRDISNVILRVPKYIARGRTISKKEHCKLLSVLANKGFDEREKEILDEYLVDGSSNIEGY